MAYYVFTKILTVLWFECVIILVMGTKGRPTVYHFNMFLLGEVYSYTLQNLTLKKISSIPGMPPVQVLYYWNKKYPCLRKAISDSKTGREDYKLEVKIEQALAQIEF